MAVRHIIEEARGKAEYRLPAPISREIGRIVVHWAHFEDLVQYLNRQMVGLSDSQARIALREPRVTDRLEMLHELIKLKPSGQWDDELYRSILSRARLLTAKRDMLSHGVWGKRPDGWYVQMTRGSWPKNLRELVQGSRKINPQMVPVTVDTLRETTEAIATLIDDMKRLGLSATARRPSPEKSL
jgi:hypothetical protein